MTQPTPTARDLARRSQQAAGAKDRTTWLRLFTPDAVVEDPVGPSPLDPQGNGHHGIHAITAFYDNVIATVDTMTFEIERSYLCGNEVADVGTIHLALPGTPTRAIRGVFTYRTNGAGSLTAIRAFWEFNANQSPRKPPTGTAP